jgi:hypothetical protein
MSNEDAVLHSQLLDLWKDLEALEGVYHGSKISCYQPIGNQPAFHAADSASVRLVLGSNRSGKSVAGVVEAIANSLGYRPWVPEGHPDRIVRLTTGDQIPVPNVGRVIAQNFEQAIVQTIWPKFEEWAPRGQYKIKRDNRGIPKKILWKNGSIVHFMSNDQDDMAFEGTSGHWVWADEPIDYAKYVGLKRGLVDFSGHMWMTMTPLSQPWIADVIANRANEPGGNVRLFKFSIWENCVENGGHLRREDIEEFLRDLREDELEARLHGNFLHLAGRVYKEWEPEPPHWIDPIDIPDTWPRVCVIDPHPRKPIAVLWAAVNPDGQWFVYRDLFDNKLRTVSDVAEQIKAVEGWTRDVSGEWVRGEEAEPVCLRIIDSSANEQERTSGDTIWKRFASEQLWCAIAKKRNAQAGYDAIHEALKLQTEWSEPGLVVFNNCGHVKHDFMNFVYDDWSTSKQRELKGDKQDYRKNNDDFIDCIRYIFQMGINYRSMRSEMRNEGDRYEEDHSGIGMFTGQPPMTRRERQALKKDTRRPGSTLLGEGTELRYAPRR